MSNDIVRDLNKFCNVRWEQNKKSPTVVGSNPQPISDYIKVKIALFSLIILSLFSIQVHSLGFSVYINNNNYIKVFKPLYVNATANDLLVDDAYNPNTIVERGFLNYYNKPQAFPRLILDNNYSELTSTGLLLWQNNVDLARLYNFSSKDYIGYDSEDWNLTPIKEQENQANYTQLACNYVHANGYSFAFTPELDVPGWGQFDKINWTCINLLVLQEQFLTNDSAQLSKNVTGLLAISKGRNPNLIVYVQLDMNVSLPAMTTDINDLAQIPGINGIMIQDSCYTYSCNNTLDTEVNYIKSSSAFAGKTSTSVATTSSISSSASNQDTALAYAKYLAEISVGMIFAAIITYLMLILYIKRQGKVD